MKFISTLRFISPNSYGFRNNILIPFTFKVNFNAYSSSPVEDVQTKRKSLQTGPTLNDFINGLNINPSISNTNNAQIPYLNPTDKYGFNRKVYFDIYGCQMNTNDTEIIWSILKKHGFLKTDTLEDADVVLVVTCAIREGAETKIWNKLEYLKGLKNKRAKFKDRVDLKIGILGCMAERLKHKLVEREKAVDLVAGPDSYRDLPRLLALTENNQTAVNVLLSLDETYADIMPVRLNENSVSAFVSIMRGCDNMCTYCIVPFTRGRERSRPISSIVEEVKLLSEQGIKEVTLLGQNVNSYRDTSVNNDKSIGTVMAKGFKTVYKEKKGGLRFANLLDEISAINPEMRVRFTSPHPKDFPDEVLQLIRERANICKNLHLPAQSGNSAVLERMRRGYTREAYCELVEHVRSIIPNVALSSDFICGFCGETDDEFADTLSLIKKIRYNMAYLFPYSMREKTTAYRKYQDDVPQTVKMFRLQQMVALYRSEVEKINQSQIGQHQLILVEGTSRRSDKFLAGRNDGNIKVIIPNIEIPVVNDEVQYTGANVKSESISIGDYVAVQINSANSQVLKGIPLYKTTLVNYHRNK